MKTSYLSLRHYSRSLTSLTAAFLGLFWAFGSSLGHGDPLDYTVAPKPQDNFKGASFRCVNPDPQTSPEYILVFIPGTDGDGRGIVAEPRFLSIGKACHAILVGCSFQGIERGYDVPSGGTGAALDEAISDFATKLGQPKLAKAPLLLIGHSQGGNFTYNYMCWHPERVKVFAATKWMIPGSPTPASFQVPGLLVTGEKDESGRIESITKTFTETTGQHSKWAFLDEKGAGHNIGDDLFAFIHIYFAAVCLPQPGDTPVLLNAQTGNVEASDSVAAGVCWFPNQQAADAWKVLHKPGSLQDLITISGRP